MEREITVKSHIVGNWHFRLIYDSSILELLNCITETKFSILELWKEKLPTDDGTSSFIGL